MLRQGNTIVHSGYYPTNGMHKQQLQNHANTPTDNRVTNFSLLEDDAMSKRMKQGTVFDKAIFSMTPQSPEHQMRSPTQNPPPVQHQSATAADIAWYQHQQNAPWNWQASTNSPYGMPSRHFPFPPGAGIVPTTDFRLNSDLAAGGPSKFGMAPTVDTSGDPGTIGPRNTPDGTLQNLAYPNEPSGVTKAGTARRGRKRSSANAGGTLGDQDLDYAAFSEQRLKALEATQDLKGSVIAVDWNSDSTFKHVRRAHPEIQEGQSTTIIPVKQKMKTARYIKKPKGNQKGRSNTSSDKTKLVASDSEISPIVTSVSPTSVNRAPLSAEPCDFDAEPGKISEQGESGFVPSSSTATQSNVAITSTTSTSPSTKKTDSEITAAAAILTNRL